MKLSSTPLLLTETKGWGDAVSDLQRGDRLVLVHQMGHDGVQGALPLAGGTGARARVRPELAQLFVFCLVGVGQGDFAPRRGVLAGEEYGVGHLFHGEVPDGAQRASAGGAAGELGPTVGTYLAERQNIDLGVHRGRGDGLMCHRVTHQVSGLALQDRWQHIVETDGTLE